MGLLLKYTDANISFALRLFPHFISEVKNSIVLTGQDKTPDTRVINISFTFYFIFFEMGRKEMDSF